MTINLNYNQTFNNIQSFTPAKKQQTADLLINYQLEMITRLSVIRERCENIKERIEKAKSDEIRQKLLTTQKGQ